MALFDQVRQFLSMSTLHERTSPWAEVPDLETRLAQVMRVQSAVRPWRHASVSEALGVPAIQRAVTLISNSTGSLPVEAYRNGAVMDEPPQVIVRPDPFSTPRDFYRDTAYLLATEGEAVWWIASRDARGYATALIVVPAGELTIEANADDRMRPRYAWGREEGTRYSPATPEGRFVHITYLRQPGKLHGVGPLQLGAPAVSVSVEAQEWAANYYAEGGHASTVIKAALALDEGEAAQLKAQWTDVPNNVPRVIDDAIDSVTETDVNPQGAQMLSARDHQNGEASRLFGVPGALLEYGAPGSSLTYQNLADVWVNFVRGSLTLNYLEPIEQALGDLLPRSLVARFATKGLQRADEKTRWEIYSTAVGVIGPDEAAQMAREREGLVPGDVELAPIPFAPPAAVPSSVPTQLRSVEEPKWCDGLFMLKGRMVPCRKLLSTSGSFEGMCSRCKKLHVAA